MSARAGQHDLVNRPVSAPVLRGHQLGNGAATAKPPARPVSKRTTISCSPLCTSGISKVKRLVVATPISMMVLRLQWSDIAEAMNPPTQIIRVQRPVRDRRGQPRGVRHQRADLRSPAYRALPATLGPFCRPSAGILLIPESPRWYLRRGNPEAAVEAVNRIISRCGRRIEPLTVAALGEKLALAREALPSFTASPSACSPPDRDTAGAPSPRSRAKIQRRHEPD